MREKRKVQIKWGWGIYRAICRWEGSWPPGQLKPFSYGLSFHEFRPRFALFPVVGTGRIDVACGVASASVVSLVIAVNSSHFKGGGVARQRQYIRSLECRREIRQATRRGNGAPTTVHMCESRATRGLPCRKNKALPGCSCWNRISGLEPSCHESYTLSPTKNQSNVVETQESSAGK
ncbi:hypothetical protein AVEN_234299-1 [Araneus ventricosus]|uniref:Uncharacterized protein n=1 Tax=Araneus ventricosus TaxID=182803 RepID=A0A4Y2A807_ARAVE|nr:hypothetical protein AVEN_234299-1 [Araneus ventricosus]